MAGSLIGLGSPYAGQPTPWAFNPYSTHFGQPIAQLFQLMQIVPQQLQQLQQLQYVEQQYLQQIAQLLQTVPHHLQQLQQQLLFQQPIQGSGLGQAFGGGLLPHAFGPQSFITQPGQVM